MNNMNVNFLYLLTTIIKPIHRRLQFIIFHTCNIFMYNRQFTCKQIIYKSPAMYTYTSVAHRIKNPLRTASDLFLNKIWIYFNRF